MRVEEGREQREGDREKRKEKGKTLSTPFLQSVPNPKSRNELLL